MSFRDEVVAAFERTFGKAEFSRDPTGILYRWRLKRENNLDVHLIIDSPEIVWKVHVLISDPCPEVIAPVRSVHISTHEEAGRVMDEINEQWRLRGCWIKGADQRLDDAA